MLLRTSDQKPVAPPVRAESPDEDDKASAYRKDWWLQRSGMRVHPYLSEAPYMQAYETLLLDKCVQCPFPLLHGLIIHLSDRHADLLVRRLNPNGSPSFHDYGRKPPSKVLDLGCGEGHWILQAATAWKHTKIVGFDLVDIMLEDLSELDTVRFVQGNL